MGKNITDCKYILHKNMLAKKKTNFLSQTAAINNLKCDKIQIIPMAHKRPDIGRGVKEYNPCTMCVRHAFAGIFLIIILLDFVVNCSSYYTFLFPCVVSIANLL